MKVICDKASAGCDKDGCDHYGPHDHTGVDYNTGAGKSCWFRHCIPIEAEVSYENVQVGRRYRIKRKAPDGRWVTGIYKVESKGDGCFCILNSRIDYCLSNYKFYEIPNEEKQVKTKCEICGVELKGTPCEKCPDWQNSECVSEDDDMLCPRRPCDCQKNKQTETVLRKERSMIKKTLQRIFVIWCLYGLVRLCIVVNPLVFALARIVYGPAWDDNSRWNGIADIPWDSGSGEQIAVVWVWVVIAVGALALAGYGVHCFSNWFFGTKK